MTKAIKKVKTEIDYNMAAYSLLEVEILIRKSVNETMLGVMEWIEKETIVVEKSTKKEILNCELSLTKNNKKLLQHYVWKRLKKVGIKFSVK